MSDQARGPSSDRRPGAPDAALLLLLAGILTALVVLIGVVATRGGLDAPAPAGAGRAGPGLAEGGAAGHGEPGRPHPGPGPIGDPGRIRETLRAGRTYRVVLKAALESRVEDKAWGIKQVVSLSYAAEMQVDRAIEVNDGRRVVELRHFVASRSVKLLCDVEDVAIDLGPPGVLLLGVLDRLRPGTAALAEAAGPIVDALLGRRAREVAGRNAARAVAHVDTLSGKRVRITYVDGLGVREIEPVGCSLDAQERDFVATTAVLSDCYIWDMKKAPGERWAVDGSQLSGLVDPSLRGTTEGEVVLVRDPDGREGGRDFAALRVEGGGLTVRPSDGPTRRVGSFVPRGTLRYSLADRIVERASLVGRFDLEEVSTGHLLFETRFKARPTLTIEYACSIR